MIGVVLAFAVGTASAAFTGSLGGFQANLATASTELTGLSDAASVKQKKAVDRSLAAVLAYSTSLGKDMATSVKVARLLEKSFPPEAPLLAAFDGVLDGLEGDVVVVRDALAAEAALLTGAKEAAAEAAVASVDASLLLAGLSSTRTERAGLLRKAEKRATGARKALRRGALAGFQGPLNGSFEEEGATPYEAAYWMTAKSGGSIFASVGSRSGSGVLSHGVYDLHMSLDDDTGTNVLSARQDGVLLTRSHRLLFDYAVNLSVNGCPGGGPFAEVLFTMEDPSVTVVLWSRDLSEIPKTGNFNIATVLDQAVDVPFLPSRGTLMFRVTAPVLNCTGIFSGSTGTVSFDHIRVE
jgi:hypothetical protein